MWKVNESTRGWGWQIRFNGKPSDVPNFGCLPSARKFVELMNAGIDRQTAWKEAKQIERK